MYDGTKLEGLIMGAKLAVEVSGVSGTANPKFQGVSTGGKEEDAKKKELRSTQNVQCEACGYKGHVLGGCFMIFPEKRPSYWKSNPEKDQR